MSGRGACWRPPGTAACPCPTRPSVVKGCMIDGPPAGGKSMSTSLRDFLKQKAALYAAESEKNRVVIEEWQAAVERLFTLLESWLRAADPDGFIQHERSQTQVTE